jgi:uncharacterized protein YqgC (DUF456 family)
MEIFFVSFSFLMVLFGIIGSLIPLLPGPFFAYIGLILFHVLDTSVSISPFVLVFLGVLLVVIVISDYILPIYGSRFFGGSKYGTRGSTLGLILGILTSWGGPWGIIIGPFLGAFFGELFFGQTIKKAYLAAWGALLGFLGSTFIAVLYSLFVCFIFIFYLVKSWF